MTRQVKIRVLAVLLSSMALAAAYQQSRTEELMVEAASRFVESLDRYQKPLTVFEFKVADRTTWHYFPEGGFAQEYGYARNGLTLGAMDPKQRHLAQGLLGTGLSREGNLKASWVMALEEIVRVIEDDTTGHRNAEGFHFTIFGEPSLTGAWGWRVEGHHLSLHYTLKNGELISASPTFFGANPHEVPQGPHQGMRALAGEEDLALGLLKSLDSKQREKAIFDEVAPYDILTMAQTRAKLEGEPEGLRASEMNAQQYDMLLALVYEYAGSMPPEIAARRMKAAQETPKEQLFFAWAGRIGRPKPKPLAPGTLTTENREPQGNYYRVQAPSFLIEYDNTQNQANHSHAVWREFDGDFGRDVLALHHNLYDHGFRGGVTAD